MFNQVQAAPPDAILGLTDAFKRDENPDKVNLGVGVYKDVDGHTPVLLSVKAAEQRIIGQESSKTYMPIPGEPTYGQLTRELIFGSDCQALHDERMATAHTPGGTGALRVAADYLKKNHDGLTVWLSDPTWANHNAIFTAAGHRIQTYAYYDPETHGVNIESMLNSIQSMKPGDVILLHGACHNPTGADPSQEDWKAILQAVKAAGVLPLIDFAYQGFGSGLDEDAYAARLFADDVNEMIVCSSFSKNFGLYNERVGAVTFMAESPEVVEAVFSQVKRSIRVNYSNPPAHGARIVSTILIDPLLRMQWADELAEMRDRISSLRRDLQEALIGNKIPGEWSFVTQQNGMFSYSGLTKEQVNRLRDEFSIYIVGSGRINVAGLNQDNIETLVLAMRQVLV